MRYEAEIIIDAPPSEVWAHLIAFRRHRDWSTTFALEGEPRVGADARVHFKLLGRALSHPVVVDTVDKDRELRWSGGPKGLLVGSHYFLLEPHGPEQNQTRFVHGEDFRGAVVPILWPLLVRAMGPAYDGFNRELKSHVEARLHRA